MQFWNSLDYFDWVLFLIYKDWGFIEADEDWGDQTLKKD